MTKKRRSLQSILVPSFLHPSAPSSPTSPTSTSSKHTPTGFTARMRSYSSVDATSFYGAMRSKSHPPSSLTSPRDSPPPDFLLDDDPFANLSATPVAPHPPLAPEDTSRAATPTPTNPGDATSPSKPRSPLTPSDPDSAQPVILATSPRSSGVSLQRGQLPPPLPFSRIQPRPAYQKPAFRSRPSLPSLHTLARMEYVVPKKIRKGRVGAGLPIDPWNSPDPIPVCSNTPPQLERPSSSQINTPSTSQVTFPVTPVSPQPLAQSHPLLSTSLNVSSDPPSPTTAAFPQDTSSTPTTHTTPPAVHPSLPPVPISPVSHDHPLMPITTAPPDREQTFLPVLSDSPVQLHPNPDIHQHIPSLSHCQTQRHSNTDQDAQASELPYTTDTDASFDNLSSPPSLSRSASLELSSASSLSRSDSLISTSSDSGSENHHRPSYTADQSFTQSSSAESEGDILNSPPEDYFSFPLHYSTTMVADWRSRYGSDLYEPDSLPTSSAISPLEVSFVANKSSAGRSGTPDHTIRASLISSPGSSQGRRGSRGSQRISDVVDGSGWGERGVYSQGSYNFSRSGYNSNTERGNGGSSRGNGGSFVGGSGGGNGRDDEDKRGWNRRYLTPSSSEPSTDDDYESADDYGHPGDDGPAATRFPSGSGASSDDDDVPLAQRIPTALTAQRSIRKQVKEEREQRRKERVARAEARSRQTTLRPAGAPGPNPQMLMSSSQEAAIHAAQTSASSRQRTLTLPSNRTNVFSAEDLAKKLQNVQLPEFSSKHRRTGSASSGKDAVQSSVNNRSHVDSYGLPPPVSPLPTNSLPQSRNHVDAYGLTPASPPPGNAFPPSQHETPARGLRPSRSFHRPERRAHDEHRPALPPMPAAEGSSRLGRSITSRARSNTNEDREGRWQPRSYPNAPIEEPVPKVPRMGDEHRRVVKAYPETKSARTSGEAERPRTSTSRPPMPPMPAVAMTQQRIFVGNMQQFNMVEIGPNTTAADVLELVEAQGSLKGWAGTGGWMVWEVAQDFGMERPIRSFELLSDVQASWNKDKMVNTFVIKLTPLAIPLRRSALPSSSPVFSGYIEWEAKRGKWSKRWLQLREHSLWISKRDNGKDEVQLCSLSNFDAYHVTRPYKSPKPFTFAVKSTDNLSFFENTADYLHVFSCKEEDGRAWMEKILVARSYVLYQERNILFNPRAVGGNGSGAALSRAGTTRKSRPSQPLVDVSQQPLFEFGSLLHKQS